MDEGLWDAARLSQAIGNQAINAIIHGDAEQPVTVTLAPPGERAGGSSGLGLGLYIANEIVVAHGGRIVVTSSAGAGTNFKVLLPGA